MIPPAGGPKDTIPPVILSIAPLDSTRNFNASRITIEFDEFVEIPQPGEIMISPTVPTGNMRVNAKLRTVDIIFEEPLEPNTTYTIDFSKTIRDINEGNAVPDFKYVFSTGPTIDSLTLSGRVLMAETGKTDTTLYVLLHTGGADSLVERGSPRYFTRLDRNGNFTFRNLPPDTFYVYAIKDDTRGFRYSNPATIFAFADDPVIAGQQTDPITLYAFAGPDDRPNMSRPPTTTGGRALGQDRRIRFSNNLNTGLQELIEPFRLTFDVPLRNFDSTGIRLSTDSTFNPVTNFSVSMDTTRKVVDIQHAWIQNQVYNIILDQNFAEDTLGRKLLKSDTITFQTRPKSEYGTVRIKLRNINTSLSPVLLLYQNDALVKSYPLAGDTFSDEYILPGEYELRILYDENGNGVWDPGNFKLRRQPELVKPVQRRITVRANWDNEFEIILNEQ